MFQPGRRVLLIYTGGEPFPPGFSTKDFNDWLNSQLEIGLIADTVGACMETAGQTSGPEVWKAVSQHIMDQKSEVDGVVVLAPPDQLLHTAATVSFMIQGLAIPLTFTGSPFAESSSAELGLKANLLNALQVITVGLSAPAIVFGNRVIRSTRAFRSYDSPVNLFRSYQSPLLGQIDFGVQLFQDSTGPQPVFRFAPEYEHRIFITEMEPGAPWAEIAKLYKGIAIHGSVTGPLPTGIPTLLKESETAPESALGQDAVIRVRNMTWEAALAKFAWLLAQTQDPKEIQSQMRTNLIGELG